MNTLVNDCLFLSYNFLVCFSLSGLLNVLSMQNYMYGALYKTDQQ